jgi:predicted metal-binding protein
MNSVHPVHTVPESTLFIQFQNPHCPFSSNIHTVHTVPKQNSHCQYSSNIHTVHAVLKQNPHCPYSSWNCMNSVDFGTVWTLWIFELYEQCGFWNCMNSVDLKFTMSIPFQKNIHTAHAVLKQNPHCPYSSKTKSPLSIQFQNKIHTVHTVPKSTLCGFCFRTV